MRWRQVAWVLLGFALSACRSEAAKNPQAELVTPVSAEEEARMIRYESLVELTALSQCLNRAKVNADQSAQILKSQLEARELSLTEYTQDMQSVHEDLNFRKQVELKLAACNELLEVLPTESAELSPVLDATYRGEFKARRMPTITLQVTVQNGQVIDAEAKQGRYVVKLKGAIVGGVLYLGGSNRRDTFRLQARYEARRHTFSGNYRAFLDGKTWTGKGELLR